MSTTRFRAPRGVSRAKLGFSLLACVVAVLGAGQIAASPSGGAHSSIQGISR